MHSFAIELDVIRLHKRDKFSRCLLEDMVAFGEVKLCLVLNLDFAIFPFAGLFHLVDEYK